MKRLQWITLGGVILAIVVGVVSFPLWSPYFIDDVVDEAFPEFTDAQREAFDDMPEDQQDTLITLAEENTEMAQNTAVSMLGDDTEAEDPMPDTEPIVLFTGTFGEYDPVHRGSGTATIYQLPDGSRILRFENFEVTNGPDLHVLLTSNAPDSILTSVNDDYVDLGQLKGNIGNQNYVIPEDVVLEDFIAVVIYCEPFHVNFSTAELSTG